MQETIPLLSDRYPLQQAMAYRNAPIEFIGEHWAALGDCFSLRFVNRRLIVVNDPEYVQHVFQGNHRNYIKAASYRKLKLLLGNGLFTSEGDDWLRQRRLIQPSFKKDALSHFVEIMANEAEQLVYRWAYFYKGGRSFSLLEEMSETTLGIVCECLLGQRLESGGKIVNEELPGMLSFMIRRALFPVNTPIWMPLPSHLRFKKSVRRIGALIAKLIREKQENANPSPDLLGMLLQMRDEETGAEMSMQQIIDEMMTFFLAGHETSAVALSWTLFLLDQHEDIAVKARTEATKLVAEGFSVEALMRPSLLKRICQESLRLYPPAWTLAREAIGADQIGPYGINPGDSVVVNSYWLHRHPRYWEHPEKFNPDRFLPEAIKTQHKAAYIPFGIGPRLCIGNHFALFEMQVVLATILSRFHVQVLSPHQPYDCTLTLRPTTGMPSMAHSV